MHFTTIASALLVSGAATLTAALPTEAPASTNTLTRRTCKIQYPTHLFQILEDDPYHNTGDHAYVYTAQGAPDGGPSRHRWYTELQFAGVPPTATGCAVEFFFRENYSGLSASGNNKLNFYSVDRDVALSDTWVNRPKEVSLVGTQAVALVPGKETKLTAVTGSCHEVMSYLIEVEGERAGNVGWFQGEGDGLRLVYDC
ncbi:hypothetical protein MPH_04860 [Macrophomina phaseolina MS6]|uniref:Ubiquitin 3 binding protein But2 C-terminal domain-containing protein n=2 Tax=Macrophomina phaseolina TaxID=35725 RepID=K2R692_MACPH|nr:hypothetical protein MPH_04860 [Macrophomina phaseolina MS6]KAH7064873.1 hypothetical protein B0J12DRAFT_734276 [Macrophomina phaseolina]